MVTTAAETSRIVSLSLTYLTGDFYDRPCLYLNVTECMAGTPLTVIPLMTLRPLLLYPFLIHSGYLLGPRIYLLVVIEVKVIDCRSYCARPLSRTFLISHSLLAQLLPN